MHTDLAASKSLPSALMRAEQSLYVTLCHHFKKWNPSPDELRERLGFVSRSSIFHLRDLALTRLGKAMSIDRKDVFYQCARESMGAKYGTAFLFQELRYCPECIKDEFHSPLFQHRAMERCPVHGCRLSSDCRNCGMALPTDVQTLAQSPFCCDACGLRIPKSQARDAPRIADTDLEKFAAWRSAFDMTHTMLSSVDFAVKCCVTHPRLRNWHRTQGAVIRRHLVWKAVALGQSRPRDFLFAAVGAERSAPGQPAMTNPAPTKLMAKQFALLFILRDAPKDLLLQVRGRTSDHLLDYLATRLQVSGPEFYEVENPHVQNWRGSSASREAQRKVPWRSSGRLHWFCEPSYWPRLCIAPAAL